MRSPIDLPCDELSARYRAGATTVTLARLFGCSPATVAKRLRQCGVVLRDARFKPVTLSAVELRRLYLDEHRPISEIAAHFGVAASTIGNKRREYGIPLRSRRAKA